MAGGEEWSIESPWMFRDKKYLVSADVREDVLVLQVEERLTADRWRGQFEPKHIEELTRKTGNYKKFPIFLNMLESALTKSSESVILDLLTYEDLESMWEKKLGSNKRGRAESPGSKPQAKRYLILTYSAEFDRIHYPLALSYCGHPDPIKLQDTIRKLHAELDMATKLAVEDNGLAALAQLQQDNSFLTRAKEELEEEFLSYKREISMHIEGNGTKETRILKRVIRNLEEELLKEHTRHQKNVNKKNQEIKELLQEIEDLRMSERQLQTRVKNLRNELMVFKKSNRASSSSTFTLRKSSQRRMSDPGERYRGDIQKSKPTNSRTNSNAGRPRRKLSSEHKPPSLNSRTPSPSGARIPRFDPTAYIQQKRRKQHDNVRNIKLKPFIKPISVKEQPSKCDHSSYRLFSRHSSCNSSVASTCSRRSSIGSESEGSEVIKQSKGRTVRGKTSKMKNEDFDDHNLPDPTLNQKRDMSDIDARLNALQEFMKRSLESAKKYSRK